MNAIADGPVARTTLRVQDVAELITAQGGFDDICRLDHYNEAGDLGGGLLSWNPGVAHNGVTQFSSNDQTIGWRRLTADAERSIPIQWAGLKQGDLSDLATEAERDQAAWDNSVKLENLKRVCLAELNNHIGIDGQGYYIVADWFHSAVWPESSSLSVDVTYDKANRTITRATGSWIDDGFVVDPGTAGGSSAITILDLTLFGNTGTYLIEGVTATVLTIRDVINVGGTFTASDDNIREDGASTITYWVRNGGNRYDFEIEASGRELIIGRRNAGWLFRQFSNRSSDWVPTIGDPTGGAMYHRQLFLMKGVMAHSNGCGLWLEGGNRSDNAQISDCHFHNDNADDPAVCLFFCFSATKLDNLVVDRSAGDGVHMTLCNGIDLGSVYIHETVGKGIRYFGTAASEGHGVLERCSEVGLHMQGNRNFWTIYTEKCASEWLAGDPPYTEPDNENFSIHVGGHDNYFVLQGDDPNSTTRRNTGIAFIDLPATLTTRHNTSRLPEGFKIEPLCKSWRDGLFGKRKAFLTLEDVVKRFYLTGNRLHGQGYTLDAKTGSWAAIEDEKMVVVNEAGSQTGQGWILPWDGFHTPTADDDTRLIGNSVTIDATAESVTIEAKTLHTQNRIIFNNPNSRGFLPGMRVTVTGAANAANNGDWIIEYANHRFITVRAYVGDTVMVDEDLALQPSGTVYARTHEGNIQTLTINPGDVYFYRVRASIDHYLEILNRAPVSAASDNYALRIQAGPVIAGRWLDTLGPGPVLWEGWGRVENSTPHTFSTNELRLYTRAGNNFGNSETKITIHELELGFADWQHCIEDVTNTSTGEFT